MHRKKFTQSSSEIILTKTILQYCRCLLAHIGRFSTLETAINKNTFAIYFMKRKNCNISGLLGELKTQNRKKGLKYCTV